MVVTEKQAAEWGRLRGYNFSVSTRFPDFSVATDIWVWLQETAKDKYYRWPVKEGRIIYCFQCENLAFEFKMRWG